jgi:hypothetical protein
VVYMELIKQLSGSFKMRRYLTSTKIRKQFVLITYNQQKANILIDRKRERKRDLERMFGLDFEDYDLVD